MGWFWDCVNDCVYFLQHFCIFFQLIYIISNLSSHFPTTFLILHGSKRVLHSAHTYALSGCTNVPTNRPTPANPPPPTWPTRPHPAKPCQPPQRRPAPPTPPLHPHPGGRAHGRGSERAACSRVRVELRRSCCGVAVVWRQREGGAAPAVGRRGGGVGAA